MDELFTLELLHIADQEAGAAAVQDAPRLSAVLNALKAQDLGEDGLEDNTLILSSGDAFIPGLFFDASEPVFGASGVADIQIQNELGIQAIALGNHEFDLGTRTLSELITGQDVTDDSDPEEGIVDTVPEPIGTIFGATFTGANFPYLSTNLDFTTDAFLAPLEVEGGQAPLPNSVTSSVVIEVNGENVGVVGATTPTLASISSAGDVGVFPSPFDANPTAEQLDALAAVIQAEVDALIAANPDLNKIVLLSHMQQITIEYGLAERLENVDIIVAGGSNTRLLDDDDRLRAGDSDQGQYPQFFTNAGGTQTAVVNTDGSYKYVGRLVLDFDTAGNLITDSYSASVSGAYATDEEGVAALGAEGLVDPEIQAIADAIQAQIIATESNVFGIADVFLNGNRSGVEAPDDPDGVRTQETNLGNLTADANLAIAQAFDSDVVVSIKNGGGIRASIGQTFVPPGSTEPVRTPNEAVVDSDGNLVKPEGGISQNDIQTTLAFNNGLSLLTLTKAELIAVLEHGVSALPEVAGRFPQIAGIKFSYDPDLAVGDRILNAGIFDENDILVAELVRDGEIVGDASETFRVVTLNFLADGGDDYPFPTGPAAERLDLFDLNADGVDDEITTGDALFAPDGTEQDALAEYLFDNFSTEATAFDQVDTGRDLDERIQNLNFHMDTILGDDDGVGGDDDGDNGGSVPPLFPEFENGFDGPFAKIGSLELADGAEINAFDAGTQKLFVVSGEPTLQVVSLSDPTAPVFLGAIDLSEFGAGINSVAVFDSLVAVAVEADETGDNGTVVFFNADTEEILNSVTVGALPDMLTFTPDGSKVLVANEGEPNEDYTIDPEGSISIIDLSNGVENASVDSTGFTAFNSQKADLQAEGVKLFGLNATVAQDVEPEYIAVSPDGLKAWVALQENNAVALLDIASATVEDIIALGFKDFSLPGNTLDASNEDGGINLQNWPVFGQYQPDAIASFQVDGVTYYATANEGDARIRPDGDIEADDGTIITPEGEFFNEEARIADVVLDPTAFPNAAELQLEENLGRLNITTALGDTDGDGDFDELYSYGGRSFSIFDENGNLVFDSGDDIAKITATLTPELFNANDGDPEEFDQRSDDKGAEPEALTIGQIGDQIYAFIGLERAGGGVLIYNVTDPTAPVFEQYVRDDADIAPEGLSFISSDVSPNSQNLLVVANEESSTLAIYAAEAVNGGAAALDFEGFDAGTIITDQFDGVTFSTSHRYGVMLFDTENVTGQDFDLATENEGNVLIISEDGDALDPDDNAGGGTIRAQFDGLAFVDSIGLLDIEEPDGLITFYGEDDSVMAEIEIAAMGDNSLQQVSLGIEDVSYLDIFFPGSGAITELAFDLGEALATVADIA